MKKALIALVLLASASLCHAQLFKPTAQVDNNAGTGEMAQYNGPKARIAVADFDVLGEHTSPVAPRTNGRTSEDAMA